jgi:hypothetical protein
MGCFFLSCVCFTPLDMYKAGRGGRPRPLPASPCSVSAPYPHQLPSRARALVSCRL